MGHNDDKDRVNLAQAARNLIDNLPAMLDYYTAKAKLERRYYTELVAQGFSKDEALQLVKARQM